MTALIGILTLFTLTLWLGKHSQKLNVRTYALVALISMLQVAVTLYAMYTLKPPVF